MRGSVVAFVLAVGLAVVVLLFGLAEARNRQRKSETIDELKERLDDLEMRVRKLERPKG